MPRHEAVADGHRPERDGDVGYTLGVDLGTTYTAAATWRDGQTEVATLGTYTLVADIGLEHAGTTARRATPALLDVIPRRSARDTKYSSGAVLVVGGQPET